MVGQSQRKVDGGRIPGAQAVPQCVEVRMWFTHPTTKIFTCTLHGRNSGSFNPSIATANNLYIAMEAAFHTRLNTYMAVGLRFDAITVRDMTDPTFPEFRSNAASTAEGAGPTALPADVSAVLTENLVSRGRGQKGRCYLAGWATSADTGTGQILAATQTALNQLGTDWMANMLAASLVTCVPKPARQEYIGLTGALHPARDAGTIDVSSLTCRDTEWDTQRRRGH